MHFVGRGVAYMLHCVLSLRQKSNKTLTQPTRAGRKSQQQKK